MLPSIFAMVSLLWCAAHAMAAINHALSFLPELAVRPFYPVAGGKGANVRDGTSRAVSATKPNGLLWLQRGIFAKMRANGRDALRVIFFLQLRLPPISSGDQLAAGLAAALALHFVWLNIGHRVVDGQFLTGGDAPYRGEDNLTLQS